MSYGNTFSNGNRGAAKLYAEVLCVAEDVSGGHGFLGFGIADGTLPLDASRVGSTSASVGFYTDGNVYNNAAVATASSGWTAGDWCAIAVDTVAKTVQFRNISAAGAWSSAVSISALSGALYLVASATNANDSLTANFDGAFIGVVPTGFTRWDGSASGAATGITGTLAVTELSDSLAATGAVVSPPITATLTVAQAPQTLSAHGGDLVAGSVNVTQAPQTLAATGGVVVRGTLVATQTSHTVSAGASVVVRGTLGATQSNQAISANASVISGISGTLNVAQAAQALSGHGTVAIGAALSIGQAAQTLSAKGWTTGLGQLNVFQGAQTLSAHGTVAFPAITATLAQTQAPQTLSASAGDVTGGSLHVVQAPQVIAASAASSVAANLNLTQASQRLTASGVVFSGDVSAEDAYSVTATRSPPIQVTASSTAPLSIIAQRDMTITGRRSPRASWEARR